ncbi:MAG: hypothetical protein JO309_00440 [Pseudonocardiales bacterium]|nr:hypothetical protein [Pseudonocardiales bacterium]
MARTKQPPKDLTGIRQRGATYQVRISAGYDPVTGRQLMLSGSADTKDAAIVIRDQLRQQVRDNTAARTNVRSATCSMSGCLGIRSRRRPVPATGC